MKIAIAGTGYVGLSNAILLAQHNEAQEMESDPISFPISFQLEKLIRTNLVMIAEAFEAYRFIELGSETLVIHE